MKSFKDLEVRILSIDLVVDVYELTRQFPAATRHCVNEDLYALLCFFC